MTTPSPPTLGPDSRDGRGQGRGGRGRSSLYVARDLTSGSIPRNLWFLAWPPFVEGILRVVDQVADLVWAGFLGHRAIAGMGAAQQYAQMGFTARMGIDTSMRAMVSRAIGMGNPALANQVVLHAMGLTLVYSFLLALVGIFLTETLLRLVGISDRVVAEGAVYMQVQFVGQAAIGLQMLTGHSLAASGDTLTPMKAALVSRIIHLLLSPALVFGLAGLPTMGLPGAALANIIAHLLSLLLILWVLFTGASRLHLRLEEFHLDATILKQLIKIGLPASINGVERSMSQILLLAMVAPFGDYAVAAFSITRRVEMFAHMGSQGLGQASGIIVGQSLGAGKPERARQTVIWGAGFATVINTGLMILIFTFPTVFLSLFTREPEFLEVAKTWLLIQAIGYALVGLGMVVAQSFQTAGDTMIVMLVNLGTLWAVEVPLALLLSRATPLGELGIAWAMVAPWIVRPMVFIPYFLWGRWLRVRVFV